MPSHRWDDEYAAGQWDFLAFETPRLAVVAAYCRDRGSVLDLGCGTGLLYEWLYPPISSYVGVDLSSVAIEQARKRLRAHARFEVGDMTAFELADRFDVVVISEALFYVPNPDVVIRQAAKVLRPDGVIVIAMYETRDTALTWLGCANTLHVVDQTRVIRGKVAWTVRLCRPNL